MHTLIKNLQNNLFLFKYNSDTSCRIIIIITVFNFVALQSQNKADRRRAKKASSIQYGYRKCETHARVLTQTLARGSSKNYRRQRNRRRPQE